VRHRSLAVLPVAVRGRERGQRCQQLVGSLLGDPVAAAAEDHRLHIVRGELLRAGDAFAAVPAASLAGRPATDLGRAPCYASASPRCVGAGRPGPAPECRREKNGPQPGSGCHGSWRFPLGELVRPGELNALALNQASLPHHAPAHKAPSVSGAALLGHLPANVGALRLELLHRRSFSHACLPRPAASATIESKRSLSMRLDTRTSHESAPCALLLSPAGNRGVADQVSCASHGRQQRERV
jgi:hypothetical protein